MKIVLLISGYSLRKTFEIGFKSLNHDVITVNYSEYFPEWKHKADMYSNLLPYILKTKWRNYFLKQINDKYLNVFHSEKPDLVFVYNDQMLLGETIREYKSKNSCRFYFYLGDSPFYLKKREFFIDTLLEADYIFAPDTYWLKQLNRIGIEKTDFLIPGYNQEQNFKKIPSKEDREKYAHDLFYIGNAYPDQWGYKRAMFLSAFLGLDFLIYGGKGWKKWFDRFPELSKRITISDSFVSYEKVNTIMNCCKIYPVDANPGLIHGIHVRVLDCIGSGILPIVEYRKDLDTVFGNIPIPTIKNYKKAKDVAKYYIENDNERNELTRVLNKHINTFYNPGLACEKIIGKAKW